MDQLIKFVGLHGEAAMVPKEKIALRPSVYGLIISEGKLLLTITKSTGKYWPPGGGIDIGETMEMALKREVLEECGIEIDVSKPLFFREKFFYYAPTEEASQIYLLFFLGTPKNASATLSSNDLHDESIDPQWVEISSLKSADFQGFGEEIMEYLNTL